MTSQADKIIVALDTDDPLRAENLARLLAPFGVRFKIGMELYYAEGPKIIDLIRPHGDIFLDLKLHDIPKTMARAASVLTDLGVWMFNVHVSAGKEALEAVCKAVTEVAHAENIKRPLVLGVTVLTSLMDLSHLGVRQSAGESAALLAKMCLESGLDGVVCSPREVIALKKNLPSLLCVTPGIRSVNDVSDDQKRTLSAKEAFAVGSDYLVIGRPITEARDAPQALQKILESLG